MDRREYMREYNAKRRDKQLAYLKQYNTTPKGLYTISKNNARIRGIKFNLTFDEWFKIWQDSGKFNQRGKCREQYVMCRYNDIGAYEVDNVFIDTCSNNVGFCNKNRVKEVH